MSVRLAVVGGGIAGLSAAWELSRATRDVEIDVLEGSDRVGGKLRRERVGGFPVDVGAESVLARRPEALDLMTALGLGPDLVHPAHWGASIVARGRCWPMPVGTLSDVLLEPLLGGVFPGHSRAGAPAFATLRGGLGRMPEELARQLRSRGVRVRLGTMVRELRASGTGWTLTTGPTIAEVRRHYDAVVLATPAAPTARLVGAASPETGRWLKQVQYASMAIATIALDGPPPTWMDVSGFLVAPTEPLTIEAATFSSVTWPWLASERPDRTYLRVSMGRPREEATLQRPDAELAGIALADLAAVVGETVADPIAVHVQRWGGGLPLYAPGHRDLVEQARAHLPPGLALAGAASDGVDIPACIASGRRAAEDVLTHVRLRPEQLR